MKRFENRVSVNSSRIFWGVFLIAAAVFVVLNQMGIWTYRLGFWAIVGAIFFLAGLINGVLKFKIVQSVFSLAFLLMIFAEPLHITKLVPWTILLAAVLISLGLEIIFRNRFHTITYANKKIKNFREKREDNSNHLFTETVSTDRGAHVQIDQTLSDTSRYIHSKELETINITAKMGDINVYLDDAQAAGDEVVMTITSTMSDINIFVPLSWQVENHLNPTLGDLKILGQSNGGGPRLIIQGSSTMSDIEIKYI